MTRITLLLAQGPGKPDGDIEDRLVLDIGLNAQGQIDAQAYDTAARPWLAIRERPGGVARHLEVIRLDEGWALQSTNSLDDPIWAFEGHVYRPGELIVLKRPDGETLLFRIVNSEQVEQEAE